MQYIRNSSTVKIVSENYIYTQFHLKKINYFDDCYNYINRKSVINIIFDAWHNQWNE